MIVVLVLHGMSSGQEVRDKLEHKYPFLVANRDTYKLKIHKVGRKVHVKKIDKIYYHEDSVDYSDVLGYFQLMKNSPDIIAFNFDPKGTTRKMKIHIPSKVTKLKKAKRKK